MGRAYTTLCAAFVTALVVADLVAPRLTAVGPFVFTGGMVAFPITFIVTDLVNERWGRDAARFMTWLGLGASLLALGIVWSVQRLPVAPVGLPAEVFARAFGGSVRVILGSLCAYVASQLFDIAVFHAVGRYGFLARATVSTLASQAVDTLAFVAIAFGGLGMGVASTVGLSLYVAKAGAALLAVPVLALTRRLTIAANPMAHGGL